MKDKPFSIIQRNYHYYHDLVDHLNDLYINGLETIQILETKPSGDNKKMHRATILVKDRGLNEMYKPKK